MKRSICSINEVLDEVVTQENKSKVFHSLLSLDATFSCVCPVIDREFRDNIVKEAVDPRGDSRVDLHTTLTML